MQNLKLFCYERNKSNLPSIFCCLCYFNKRPMCHIVLLRNSSIQKTHLCKAMIISITLTKREKDIIYFWELNGPFLFEAESPSLKNALRQVWLKLAEWFWKVEIVKSLQMSEDIRQAIRKTDLSFQLWWAKNINEVKWICDLQTFNLSLNLQISFRSWNVSLSEKYLFCCYFAVTI